ncbi:hypothetical protein MMC08_000350 [Hypocenomyce scalaris]|nr:hypothetical protein [Hypocenomyce scalaris]
MSAARLPPPDLFSAQAPAGPSSQSYQSGGAGLRRTCHACAASKLKCSSEKPTCLRCAKRDEPCTYVVAKRGGRRPNKRSSLDTSDSSKAAPPTAQTDERTASASPATWFSSSSFGLGGGPLSSPELLQQPERQDGSASEYSAPNLAGSLDQSLFPMMDAAADLSELFTSPRFSTDLGDIGFLGTTDFLASTFDGHGSGSTDSFLDAFPTFEEATSDSSAISVPGSVPSYSTVNASSTQNPQQSSCPTSSSPPCTCLVEALGFMKQLSTPTVTYARSPSTRHGSGKATVLQAIQSVLAQNEAVLPAVVAMVNCNCSREDGYLLTVISLLIFKVLGRYAVVIRKTSILESSSMVSYSRQPSPARDQQQQQPQQQRSSKPAIIVDFSLEGNESARMTAQLVLNELHRVRRLVDQISAKLKTHATRNSSPDTVGDTEMEPERMDSEGGMALPLSAVMYHQMGTDLRKQLQALSRATIDQLKRL